MSEGDQPLARVGVREMRQNLSVYLRRVKEGETLEVTEHGQPVAYLAPLPDRSLSRYERMVRDGWISRGNNGDLADLGPPPPAGPGRSLSEILAEMRDEDPR